MGKNLKPRNNMFFKRSFQGVKEIVGVSKKTEDNEVNQLKIELQNTIKKLKKASSSYSKLPDAGRSSTVCHMQAMKDGKDLLGEGCCCQECYSIFEEIDMKGHLYGMKIKEEVIEPIQRLVEACTIMEKRTKTLGQRRLDMDAAHDKYESIAKKAPEKQNGLAEAETRYNEAKDNYDYLRNEIVTDINKCIEQVKIQFPQICVNCMKSYTDYINELNEIWTKVPNIISSIPEVDLKQEIPITPNEQSMIVLENVRAKKNNDLGGFVNDDFTTQTKPTEPTTPVMTTTQPTNQFSTVTALYDYTAVDAGELSFKEGDVITVLEKSGDWWSGELNGVKGIFPSNYVN
ncbi:BAR/SH3 domain containing protein [Entamoeba histolytica HM-1:IMSS-B]|nr:BAR/SH3 domain containing protein [Entamoeba histolytica KU27]EMH72905.1 BAR/SH3 domain containing protein [Entamoeba histolytica HM-1:IMSS-B]